MQTDERVDRSLDDGRSATPLAAQPRDQVEVEISGERAEIADHRVTGTSAHLP